MTTPYEQLDQWIDAHFDEEVAFLQELVRVPTDTPPGNNAPHAERTADLLAGMGLQAEKHAVPEAEVKAAGLETITNLIVRRRFGDGGKTIALNAHGDVVPPGEGWTHDPYGGAIVDGKIYGRATAVSKCDIANFSFAIRALESLGTPLRGGVELHVTYDEEYGGEVGPDWLLKNGLTKPDLMIAAGFSYQVVVAHNGCLQLEVTVHGDMAHAAIPDSGTDALQGAVHILNALYALNADYLKVTSSVEGITHPYLNVGQISGGTNTNVIPGKVVLKVDRRMIPEEDPAEVEASLRQTIAEAATSFRPPRGGSAINVEVKRILLARALKPLPGNQPLVQAIQQHGQAVFGETIPAVGTPLYTDVRIYGEHGIPGVIYGAGPRTVRESNAKRADENLVLDDLRRATKVVARTLLDLLKPA
ncbi:MAG: M20/M25/M40 family metallo-hydrolase [Hydrogenophaga sp.]|uniref:M20 family metallopeptidase n=1 Tax=Hydrogenophaga sp. TaxID=1904254 RepID=UPI0027258BE7|nr:M20/M25/M40 family metallo-hydrolase [Hydrogenophaga sp.]MDO9480210.1 M20/M25/M40 family metallo-hydrolase [Hydrogenophaga sp.]MDP3345375.1 M20/M25/M40 family metallo-hydrolase [Hydrogenophaga sp.]MDP3805850.1 M20/M25/M40 family metallo-hydrolase [Hydrogenophaga sp.]